MLRASLVCIALERRELPSSASFALAALPSLRAPVEAVSFRSDPQSMRDLNRLGVDLRALKAGAEPVVARLAVSVHRVEHDEVAISVAMRNTAAAPEVNAMLKASTFNTFTSTGVDREAHDSAALRALDVPPRLLKRLVTDRHAISAEIDSIASGGTVTVKADERAVLNDGIRTGSIRVGDPVYDALTIVLADKDVEVRL